MKKLFKSMIMVLSVVAIGLSVVGCGNKKEESKLDVIKKNGVLVVGTAPGYPPFEFINGVNGKNEVVGADIDLAKKVAEKLGVKLEVKTMDFDAIIPSLVSDKIDMAITGMTPTDERKKTIDFSDVYFEGTNSVMVSEKFSGKLDNLEDLKKLKVGVQKGSTQEVFAKETVKIADVKSLVSIPDLLADMKNGNIDAIIVSTTVAKINEKKYDGVKVLDKVDMSGYEASETAAIAINKGDNEALLSEVNGLIKEIKSNGEYEKILNKNIDEASKVKGE